MLTSISNASFSSYLEEYALKKRQNPKNCLYLEKGGAVVVSDKKPKLSQKIEFDALLQEAEKRTLLRPLQKISVARNLSELSDMENPSWFAKTFKKEKVQHKTEQVKQVIDNLNASAENEAATTLQKAFRKHRKEKAAATIQKAFRKYMTAKKEKAATTIQRAFRNHISAKKEKAAIQSEKVNEAVPEKPITEYLQKLVKAIKALFASLFELFEHFNKEIKPEPEKPPALNPVKAEETPVKPPVLNPVKAEEAPPVKQPVLNPVKPEKPKEKSLTEMIQQLNKDYISLFEALGQKEGHPTIVSSEFKDNVLHFKHNKPSQLTCDSFAKGSICIPQELDMRYEMIGTQATVTFLTPIQMKIKLPFQSEKTYAIENIVLQNNKFTINLSGNEKHEFDISNIIKSINKLNWS